MYQLTGKSVPFLLIAFLAVLLLGKSHLRIWNLANLNKNGFVVAFSVTLRVSDHQQQRNEDEFIEEDICFSAENCPSRKPVEPPQQYVHHRHLVLGVVVGAIFISTSVMSLLEPCLPFWLMKTMKPEVRIDLI